MLFSLLLLQIVTLIALGVIAYLLWPVNRESQRQVAVRKLSSAIKRQHGDGSAALKARLAARAKPDGD